MADKRSVIMNKRLLDGLSIISKIVMWALGVLVIYWLILKLTGHSPTYDQLILAIVSILATGFFAFIIYFIQFSNRVYQHMGRVENHMKDSDRRFHALANDFKTHIKEMH
jgi:uncharacterized membrane protein